jgi:heterodisulfide reductase subunit B
MLRHSYSSPVRVRCGQGHLPGRVKGIETAFNTSYNIPVLYLTQILGLAMGMDRKEPGLNMKIVKTKEALAKYSRGE